MRIVLLLGGLCGIAGGLYLAYGDIVAASHTSTGEASFNFLLDAIILFASAAIIVSVVRD